MANQKTSRGHQKSGKKSLRVYEPFTSNELKDPDLVIEVLLDCIMTGDLQSFRETLVAHLLTVNKAGLAKKAGVGRQTIYDLLDFKKEFNPGLATVAAIFKALKAA
jgi:DNA-binding phage protein